MERSVKDTNAYLSAAIQGPANMPNSARSAGWRQISQEKRCNDGSGIGILTPAAGRIPGRWSTCSCKCTRLSSGQLTLDAVAMGAIHRRTRRNKNDCRRLDATLKRNTVDKRGHRLYSQLLSISAAISDKMNAVYTRSNADFATRGRHKPEPKLQLNRLRLSVENCFFAGVYIDEKNNYISIIDNGVSSCRLFRAKPQIK